MNSQHNCGSMHFKINDKTNFHECGTIKLKIAIPVWQSNRKPKKKQKKSLPPSIFCCCFCRIRAVVCHCCFVSYSCQFFFVDILWPDIVKLEQMVQVNLSTS